MAVIKNNQARKMGYNGRVKVGEGSKLVTCLLLPGVTSVADDELAMLQSNTAFKDAVDLGYHEVISKKGAKEDLNIADMSAKKAIDLIKATSTIDELDKMLTDEAERKEGPRTTVVTAIEDQSVSVQDLIDKVKKDG